MLNDATARELLRAASLFGWDALHHTLQEMTKQFGRLNWVQSYATKQEQACEGLLLVLGTAPMRTT